LLIEKTESGDLPSDPQRSVNKRVKNAEGFKERIARGGVRS